MFCLYTLHSGIKASGMNLKDWKLWFGGCWLFGFAYDLMGPGFLRPPECFDYDYLGGGRVAFGCLLTQEAQTGECRSFLSSSSRFETRQQGRKKRRGVQGGADRATANTKNGCGSGPPLSPHSAARAHARVNCLKQKRGALCGLL